MPKTQHQFRGESMVYEDEMDGGEAASDRAVRRAMLRADEAIQNGTWEVIDIHVQSVVRYGIKQYTAVVTVEVDHG
jgi:hypothetical protein